MNNPFNLKVLIVILLDLLSSIFALNLSIYLRVNTFNIITAETIIAGIIIPLVFFFLNIYKRPWRYFSITDLWFLVRACLIANIFLFIIIFIFNRLENIPRLVIMLNFFVITCCSCSARIIYRSIIEKFSYSLNDRTKKVPIILIGTGDEADSFIRDSERKNSIYEVVGLVSENKEKFKKVLIRGIPVLGQLENLQGILEKPSIKKKNPQRLVISSLSMQGNQLTEIIKLADKHSLKLGRAPGPNEILEGNEKETMFREISLEDLLGRRQNRLDNKKIKNFINNKSVLVTGAGGSIGSELAKRISEFNPSCLILLDCSENAIYELKQRFSLKNNNKKNQYLCSNIRNKKEIEKIFKIFKPEIIFHAAALKHVAICEENISEAIRTNSLATFFLAEMSEKYNSKCFVLISTDKAVEPSSVMGFTKKIAEIIIQSKDVHSKSLSRFITVRFGNVLGSTGSVVPLFKQQIEDGGPLTVTDKNVSRFFMTIQEAVDLVLSSAFEQLNSPNNQKGNINVLDMGVSVKIDTLAKQMIKMAGMTPGKEIKIKYTGLKRGEKLHEKLFAKDEKKIDKFHKGFFTVRNYIFNEELIDNMVFNLQTLCHHINKDIRKELFKVMKKNEKK